MSSLPVGAIPVVDFLVANWARFPFLIVYIVGFVFALVTWRRHPGASLLSAIAFALLFLSSVAATASTWLLLHGDLMESSSYEKRSMMLSVVSNASALMNLAAWILILIALFARRPQPPQWRPDDAGRFPRDYPEAYSPPRPPAPPGPDIRP